MDTEARSFKSANTGSTFGLSPNSRSSLVEDLPIANTVAPKLDNVRVNSRPIPEVEPVMAMTNPRRGYSFVVVVVDVVVNSSSCMYRCALGRCVSSQSNSGLGKVRMKAASSATKRLNAHHIDAVSYTHLTLPTKDGV